MVKRPGQAKQADSPVQFKAQFILFPIFSFFSFLIFSADRGKTSFLPFNESLKSHLIFEIFVTYKYWTEIFFRNYGAYFFNIP